MSTASLGGSKIFGEIRVNLKITFPTLDNEALEVRAKPHKLLSQVILHVLQKLQGIFHLTFSRMARLNFYSEILFSNSVNVD